MSGSGSVGLDSNAILTCVIISEKLLCLREGWLKKICLTDNLIKLSAYNLNADIDKEGYGTIILLEIERCTAGGRHQDSGEKTLFRTASLSRDNQINRVSLE